MITIKTTLDSKTYNSKEALKREGFLFDSASKSWSKEYESIEDFNAFETEKFRSAAYGRRQARENEAVRFEVVTEVKAVEIKEEKVEIIVENISIEKATAMIENGEVSFNFSHMGREAKLEGFFVTEIATGKITDIRVFKGIEPTQYTMFIDFLATSFINR